MSEIYAIFCDSPESDNPSVLYFIGTDLKTVDLQNIFHCCVEWGAGVVIYVCKFDLINGGCNTSSFLVGFNAEPCLIENFAIFKGKYPEFVKYINESVKLTLAIDNIPKPKPSAKLTSAVDNIPKPKPKQPMNAFMFFNKEMYKNEYNKGLSKVEVIKKIQHMWKNLNDFEKQKYIDLANEDKKRYESEIN